MFDTKVHDLGIESDACWVTQQKEAALSIMDGNEDAAEVYLKLNPDLVPDDWVRWKIKG